MTFAEELASRYSEIRRRLHGPPRIVNFRLPEPDTEPKIRLLTTHDTTWRDIVNQVTLETGVTYEQMCCRKKRGEWRNARNLCWYRIRTEVVIHSEPASYPTIGRWFGGRDHTSIIHGVQRHCRENGIPYP